MTNLCMPWAQIVRRVRIERGAFSVPVRAMAVAIAILAGLGAHATLAQQAPEPVVRVDTIDGTAVTFEMVRVPAGSVRVETPDGPRDVAVGPFWIGKTEVTWDEFDIYALGLDLKSDEERDNDLVIRPSKPYGAPDRGFGHRGYAALSMSWPVAMEYARWLSLKTGDTYRIPTAAEWQYACLAGAATDPGDDKATLEERAWFWDNAWDETHPVASLAPNDWGAHDMLGNAMEWCLVGEEEAVACGGSFEQKADQIGCDVRIEQTPGWQETDPQIPKSMFWLTDAPFIGFRILKEVEVVEE